MLSGSAPVKAACRTLMKLTPGRVHTIWIGKARFVSAYMKLNFITPKTAKLNKCHQKKLLVVIIIILRVNILFTYSKSFKVKLMLICCEHVNLVNANLSLLLFVFLSIMFQGQKFNVKCCTPKSN